MTKHDPQARRQAILDAAVDLVAEVGPAKLTHRLVAARADVPLGSTTAYFRSIDDLRQEALAAHLSEIDETLAHITEAFATDPAAAPEFLLDELYDYLSDSRQMAATAALNATATFDPQVRDLANRWTDGMIAALTGPLGAEDALAVTVLMDGAAVQAAVRGKPLDRGDLRRLFAPFITMGED